MKTFIFLFFIINFYSFSQTRELVSNLEEGFKYQYIFSKEGDGINALESLMIVEKEKDINIYMAVTSRYGLIISKNGERTNKTEFLKIFLRWEKYLRSKDDENLDIIKMRASNIMRELKE